MAQLSCLILTSAILLSQAVGQDGSGGGQKTPQDSAPSTPPSKAQRPEAIVLKAIQANPVSAPYRIKTSWQKGLVVISGRVGSSAVHDVVVRTAIDLGYPFRDDLTVDTSEAARVAPLKAQSAVHGPESSHRSDQAGDPARSLHPPSFPLREDDPVFGPEPPLVTFPPGWKRADTGKQGSTAPSTGSRSEVNRSTGTANQTKSSSGAGTPRLIGPTPGMGRVRITVDETGQVFLAGVVVSEDDRRMIEKEAWSTPGVTCVFSELRVEPRTPIPRPGSLKTSPIPPEPPSPVAASPYPPLADSAASGRSGPHRDRTKAEQTPVPLDEREADPPASDAVAPGVGVYFVILLASLFLIYFLPSFIALFRNHHDFAAIAALNLFLGWTFLGWVVALCWALTQVRSLDHRHVYVHHDKYF